MLNSILRYRTARSERQRMLEKMSQMRFKTSDIKSSTFHSLSYSKSENLSELEKTLRSTPLCFHQKPVRKNTIGSRIKHFLSLIFPWMQAICQNLHFTVGAPVPSPPPEPLTPTVEVKGRSVFLAEAELIRLCLRLIIQLFAVQINGQLFQAMNSLLS